MKLFITFWCVLLGTAAGRAYQYNKPPLNYPPQAYQTPAGGAAPTKSYIVHTLGPNNQAFEIQMLKSHQLYVGQIKTIHPGTQFAAGPSPHHSVQANPLLAGGQTTQSAPIGLTPPGPVPHSNGLPAAARQTTTGGVSSADIALNNPEPYALLKLPDGAYVQDGGHGAGGQNALTAGNRGQTRLGNYHAQSQASQLDYYGFKQTSVGDARDFQRAITTCYPNGQCEQVAVGPGQTEAGHQQFLIDARARTAPYKDGCQQFAAQRATKEAVKFGISAAAAANLPPQGTERNSLGQLRPRNRRTFPYTESIRARDPYN